MGKFLLNSIVFTTDVDTLEPRAFFARGSRDTLEYGIYLGRTDLAKCTVIYFPFRPQITLPRLGGITPDTKILAFRDDVKLAHERRGESFSFSFTRDFMSGDLIIIGERQLLGCAGPPWGKAFVDLSTFKLEHEPTYSDAVFTTEWRLQIASQEPTERPIVLYDRTTVREREIA